MEVEVFTQLIVLYISLSLLPFPRSQNPIHIGYSPNTYWLQSQYMNVYRILTETPFEVKNFSQEHEKQFIVHNC